jgi:hypothetical protein
VRKRRNVIDSHVAVDITRGGLIVEAPTQLSEIEKFGYLGADG